MGAKVINRRKRVSESMLISKLERDLDKDGILARRKAELESRLLEKIAKDESLTQTEIDLIQESELTDSSADGNWIHGDLDFVRSIGAKLSGFDCIDVWELWQSELSECESMRYRRDSLRSEDYREIADEIVAVDRFIGNTTTQYSVNKSRLDSLESRLTQYRRDSRRSNIRECKKDSETPRYISQTISNQIRRNIDESQLARLLKRREMKRRRSEAILRNMPPFLDTRFVVAKKTPEATYIPDMGGSHQVITDYPEPTFVTSEYSYCIIPPDFI